MSFIENRLSSAQVRPFPSFESRCNVSILAKKGLNIKIPHFELVSRDESIRQRYIKKLCREAPALALGFLTTPHSFRNRSKLIDLAVEALTCKKRNIGIYCYPSILFNLDLKIKRMRYHFLLNLPYGLYFAKDKNLVVPKLAYVFSKYDKFFQDGGKYASILFRYFLKNTQLRETAFSQLKVLKEGFVKDYVMKDLLKTEPLEILTILESQDHLNDQLTKQRISNICLHTYSKGRNILHHLGINSLDFISEFVRFKISQFFKLPVNRAIFRTYFNQKDDFGMTPLEYALLPPLDDAIKYKLEMLVPEFCENAVFKAIFALPENYYYYVLERIYERAPDVITHGRIDEAILKFLIKLKSLDMKAIYELMIWEFNMNPCLPLTEEILYLACYLHRVFDLDRPFNQEYALPYQVQLAFQVHSNADELNINLNFDLFNKPFPNHEEFQALDLLKKKEWLLNSIIYRDRKSIATVKKIVKASLSEPVNEDLLQLSLRNYIENGIEPSKRTSDYLRAIVLDSERSAIIRSLAIKAFMRVCSSLSIESFKQDLLTVLNSTDELELQKAVVDALAQQKYLASEEFTKSVLGTILNLAQSTKNHSLQHSLVFLMTVLPDEEALKIALDIVLSPVWDSLDRDEHFNKYAKCSSFFAFTKRPVAHDNRYNMKRIIAFRLVELYESLIKKEALELYDQFKQGAIEDLNLKNIHLNIIDLPKKIRYIPFMIFLPSGKHLFRGLRGIGEEAFVNAVEELVVKGSDKVSLKNFTKCDHSTWVKLGFVFATVSKDYAKNFFDKKGVLLAILSDFFNENLLRRQVRYETEKAIHAISYQSVRPEHFDKLFISSEHKPFIENLSSETPLHSDLRPQQKRFLRKYKNSTISCGSPIQNRIEYFNDTKDVWAQIEQSDSSEITPLEIVEATQIKYCMLKVLRQHVKYYRFKNLLDEVQKVPYLWSDAHRFY